MEVLLLRPAGLRPGIPRASGSSPGASPLAAQDAGEYWEALVRPGRRVRRGTDLMFSGDLRGIVVDTRPDGVRVIAFHSPRGVLASAREIGATPLPPYVHAPLRDPEEYQTVYAATEGAVAAPTAGLHFTPVLLRRIEARGVRIVRLTMHIGLGTFRPVTAPEVRAHRMESEWFRVSPEAAATINERRRAGGRIIPVGTSTVRTLETVADVQGLVRPGEGWSELFIYPGYRFRATDVLVTNFHLPRTTLLMLVSALAGRDLILRAYGEAIRERYRFYSFGDAMLIL